MIKKYFLNSPNFSTISEETSEEPALSQKEVPTRQVYTVSVLNRMIRLVLEERFPAIWVEGEVSNFKFHTSGHMYFALKDEEAQIQCVMFRDANRQLGFEIQDGQKILCYGRVSAYPVRGQYQLYVERVEPKGVGALALQFEKLKKKLMEQGYFEESRKRAIPYLPKTIGVVTSIDGAALRDILHVLDRRFPDAWVLIAPAQVQGDGAARSIVEAIEILNQQSTVEVMIVGRGGGSLEDLWAFNEEIVAEAIFHSRVPVISAVGHEVDFTIADFVADLRAATPSVAAERVMPPKEDLIFALADLKARATHALTQTLKISRQRLESVLDHPSFKDPLLVFEIPIQKLDDYKKDLDEAITHCIEQKRHRWLLQVEKLEALGPLSILKRGFSLTQRVRDGVALTRPDQVKPGDVIRTRLAGGEIESKVV